ncbi:Uncharacterised protein [Sphingobacterium spiritivorum]|uniref:chitin binding peritrophin-A domain-containing protein n=2 Tax=Sphingobacterium spiritivorum TaxID=258 RepID=UPI000DFEF59E|nr:Uncharacterised protein [Sphingobacterium spiritivorum]
MKKLISKTYYFALLVVSVFIFKSAKADCKTGDTMTDAWDCRTFYICARGIWYIQRCPYKMGFDRGQCRPIYELPSWHPCRSSLGGRASTSLINPPNSSSSWQFNGGQSISIAISNFNILPVTYSISRISLLSGGVIFPGMTINKSDSIFGTPPLVYNYSISTGSSAAFISFVATW